MPNFFLTDSHGQKHTLTEQQLQALAAQGTITPQTPLETDTGHKGLAGQIPGLKFNAPSPQYAAQPAQAPVPPSANVFCTKCGQPVAEHAVACMSCGMKPTGHKRFCRSCAAPLNPEQVVCIKCGAALAGNAQAGKSGAKVDFSSNSGDLVKKLNLYFMVLWIGIAAAIPTCSLSLYVSMVFLFLLLYQLWKLVPADIARTTPGKAVGFCFIPIFCFYWFFVVYKGLAEDMNEALRQRGIDYQVSEGLGSMIPSFILLGFILIMFNGVFTVLGAILDAEVFIIIGFFFNAVGQLLNLVVIVLWIFFFKSAKNGAIALLEQDGT